MTKSYLAIDIGNTSIHLGIFQEEKMIGDAKIKAADIWELNGWWEDHFPNLDLSGCAIASVNPRVTDAVAEWIGRNFSVLPLIIGRDIQVPIEMEVKAPSEVGADRIINAYMAFREHKQSLLVVDFGTAITIDVVSEKGAYLGGIIAPGLHLAAKTLFEQTALLPLIQIQEPPQVIGKNTVEAITSGIYWGAVGMVELWVKKVSEELSPPPSLVLATGGDGPLIGPHCKSISKIDSFLTLKGIAMIGKESS